MANGTTINIPIDVPARRNEFNAALWWPESAAQLHNDIDVHLIDPSGVERAKGYSAVSVFAALPETFARQQKQGNSESD